MSNKTYQGRFYTWIECWACMNWHQDFAPCIGVTVPNDTLPHQYLNITANPDEATLEYLDKHQRLVLEKYKRVRQ